MPRASRTAEFMALFRALESARPPGERLFDDPDAAAFLGGGLGALARLARHPLANRATCALIDALWPGARPAGVARTRLVDDALREAVAGGVGQVVILGAGYDARARRLPLGGARLFEVDQPATLAAKRERLARAGAADAPGLVSVPLDFARQRLDAVMKPAGFAADAPAFFLWEGVTNYLSDQAVDAVLGFVAAAAPGSLLLFTYVHRDFFEHPQRFPDARRLRRTLRRAAEPWTFGLDPARLPQWLAERGLALVWDEGSFAWRRRHLGARERTPRGYGFYRAALARVAGGGADACPR